MAQLITNYTNFCGPSSVTVLKSGTGKIHAIFATSMDGTPAAVVIYDNTSASGDILFSFTVTSSHPVCIVLPNYLALRFYVGCTVVTPANIYVFLATEESEESFSPPAWDENSYHCRVYNSGNIALPDSTWTPLTFNMEQSDQGNMHSTVTNTGRITFPSSGFYVVGAYIPFAPNATGVRCATILKNGSTGIAAEYRNNIGAAINTEITISTGYDFAANDYVTLSAYQNSGSPINAQAPVFWAAKVL